MSMQQLQQQRASYAAGCRHSFNRICHCRHFIVIAAIFVGDGCVSLLHTASYNVGNHYYKHTHACHQPKPGLLLGRFFALPCLLPRLLFSCLLLLRRHLWFICLQLALVKLYAPEEHRIGVRSKWPCYSFIK